MAAKSSKKFDIDVKQVEHKLRHKYHDSLLNLEFTGKDCNFKLLSTLRRVACNNVPTYAFPKNLIDIEENTSVAFNNDYMRLRLSQLPIFNMPAGLSFLHNKYWKNVNFADTTREKHPDEKSIKMYVTIHNNSDEIRHVTTNDASCYIDNENVKIYDRDYPILLISLRPNDTFKCNMTAVLGVGDGHTTFCACANGWVTYDEDVDSNGKKYFKTGNLFLKSSGGQDEYQILLHACDFILKKLVDIDVEFTRKINSKEIEKNKHVSLVLDDEDHTMGEFLNDEFQNHPGIAYSGVSKPDLQIRSMLFKIESANDKDPFSAMKESIENLREKITFVKSKIQNLTKKATK